ncbi:MAG: hypothetical protein U0X93_13880 [Anaerolineales bacterium]
MERSSASAARKGFRIVGLLSALSEDLPGIGIALKVVDGDATRTKAISNRTAVSARVVMLEVLRQLGALSAKQEQSLSAFDLVFRSKICEDRDIRAIVVLSCNF